jgi:hypothetical protein
LALGLADLEWIKTIEPLLTTFACSSPGFGQPYRRLRPQTHIAQPAGLAISKDPRLASALRDKEI